MEEGEQPKEAPVAGYAYTRRGHDDDHDAELDSGLEFVRSWSPQTALHGRMDVKCDHHLTILHDDEEGGASPTATMQTKTPGSWSYIIYMQ